MFSVVIAISGLDMFGYVPPFFTLGVLYCLISVPGTCVVLVMRKRILRMEQHIQWRLAVLVMFMTLTFVLLIAGGSG